MSGDSSTKNSDIKTIVLEGPPGCLKRLIVKKLILTLKDRGWVFLPLFDEFDPGSTTIEGVRGKRIFTTLAEAPMHKVVYTNGPLFYLTRLVGIQPRLQLSGLSLSGAFLRNRTDTKKNECLFVGVGCSNFVRQLDRARRESPVLKDTVLHELNRLYMCYYEACKSELFFIDTGRDGPFTAASKILKCAALEQTAY